MKKQLLSLAAFAAFSLAASSQSTLSIGNYDDYDGYDGLTNPYDGSYWEVVPMNLYLTNSGTQIILKADELTDMAGATINSISFKPYFEGFYDEATLKVKVWISETDADEFTYDSELNKYQYFAVDTENPDYEGSVSFDGINYDYMVAPITLELADGVQYSGTKNLVVTISAEGATATADGAFYVNFSSSTLEKRALTFCSDHSTLSETLAGDRWTDTSGRSVLNAPDMQFGYTPGEDVPDEPVEEVSYSVSLSYDKSLLPDGDFPETVTVNAPIAIPYTIENTGDADIENAVVTLVVNDEEVESSEPATVAPANETGEGSLNGSFTYTPQAAGTLTFSLKITFDGIENADDGSELETELVTITVTVSDSIAALGATKAQVKTAVFDLMGRKASNTAASRQKQARIVVKNGKKVMSK